MKKLSRSDYLKALGLFTLGTSAIKKVYEADRELNSLLDLEPFTVVSDALYDPSSDERAFNQALLRAGFVWEEQESPPASDDASHSLNP